MNEILEQIYRVRYKHAEECRFDIDVILERSKKHLRELEADGWKVASPQQDESDFVLREEPAEKPGGNTKYTSEIMGEIYRVREEFARECGYDIDVMIARTKEYRKRLEAVGWKFVLGGAPVPVGYSHVLREEARDKASGN